MRILHFYKTAWPDSNGGVEQFVRQLARGTSRRSITTDVLSLCAKRNSEVVQLDGYQLHRIPLTIEIASTGFSISAFREFSRLAMRADVVHFHFPWPFMDIVHFAVRANKPTLLTYHSDIIRQQNLLKFYRPLQSKFLKSVDRIVATSPNYLRTSQVLQSLGSKVSVIPIGLDKATYPTDTTNIKRWKDRFGDRFFLFVGQLRYYKGLHILIDALQGTTFPVLIVGVGPIEDELRKQALRLGVTNIHFLGNLPDEDRTALLSLCYAVVFPSHLRSEAFGISLLEGAMFGKPMISSEIGTGTTYVNVHDESGLVVPPADSSELRNAMTWLWNSPAQAEIMGANAERRYWRYFTADQMVEKYLSLYEGLTNAGRLAVA